MDKLQLAEIMELQEIEIDMAEDMKKTKERFKIEDKEQATWALRKIRALKAQIEENRKLAIAEIARIDQWEQKENETAKNSINFFESLLYDFAIKERAADPKLKSIKLPHGTIRFRKQQPEYIRDDEKLIKWAITSGEWGLVKINESFDWATLKKEITVVDGKVISNDTGEVIDGVTATDREDKFEVDVK